MITRRTAAALVLIGASSPRVIAQGLLPIRLMVVRRPGLSPTNQCVAPCTRGSIYDVTTLAGSLDTTILPALKLLTPICDVIERPWRDNKQNVSSVKKGTYRASVRTDKTKDWMTNEDRLWRIELAGTSPRTSIQFHYGNDVSWSEGCFIVGALLQKGDDAGITRRYCAVENGEAAIAALRAVVTAPGRDHKNITVGVADDAGLFPDLSPKAPC